MENKVFLDNEVGMDVLDGKVVAVIGYGIQGQPQSLNLRDSGVNVIVGAGPRKKFPDWDRALEDGFEVMSIEEATQKADVIHILLADPAQPGVYSDAIQPNLQQG